MADAAGITVAIESVIMNVLGEVAQKIYDEHGIQLDRVDFRWLDMSRVGKEVRVVEFVHADMTARPNVPGGEENLS